MSSDVTGKSSIALLNYHGILSISIVLLQALEAGVADLPVVKKRMSQEFSKHNKMEFGLHDKVFAPGFGSADAMTQDIQGKRLDTPVLRRMSEVFQKLWDVLEPDLLPVFLLNDVPDKQLVKKGAPRKLGDSLNSKRILEENLAGVKDIDLDTYAMLVENMPVGDGANCPDFQKGVKLEGDLMEQLEKALKQRKARGEPLIPKRK